MEPTGKHDVGHQVSPQNPQCCQRQLSTGESSDHQTLSSTCVGNKKVRERQCTSLSFTCVSMHTQHVPRVQGQFKMTLIH